MVINLNEEEIVSLLFWFELFRINGIGYNRKDQKLYDKLKKAYDSKKGIKTQERTWTDKPKYQPGEGPKNDKA